MSRRPTFDVSWLRLSEYEAGQSEAHVCLGLTPTRLARRMAAATGILGEPVVVFSVRQVKGEADHE